MTAAQGAGLSDVCEHGIDYDTDCQECDAVGLLAAADGAVTPNEIGIWCRGYKRNQRAAVAAALTELDERCQRAGMQLSDLSQAATSGERDRLVGKRSGVALVRDYIRAAIPPPT